MELQELTLVITEGDLNAIARKHLPDDLPVEKLEFRILPEGLHVAGEFPLFVPVTFNTVWELGVLDGHVTARLVNMRAMGLPANVFKSMVWKIIAEGAKKTDGVTCDDERIMADVDRLAAREGVSLRSNLRSITCQAGSLVVRSGS